MAVSHPLSFIDGNDTVFSMIQLPPFGSNVAFSLLMETLPPLS
jgi:hypothetical protein